MRIGEAARRAGVNVETLRYYERRGLLPDPDRSLGGHRDYSDETARVIDEEVETILRQQEERAREALKKNRAGLDAVARTLLEEETVDGAEVGRLVDEAAGRTVPLRPRGPFPGPGGAERKADAQERQGAAHDPTEELPRGSVRSEDRASRSAAEARPGSGRSDR